MHYQTQANNLTIECCPGLSIQTEDQSVTEDDVLSTQLAADQSDTEDDVLSTQFAADQSDTKDGFLSPTCLHFGEVSNIGLGADTRVSPLKDSSATTLKMSSMEDVKIRSLSQVDCEEVLSEIWRSKSRDANTISKVGPYSISIDALNTIQHWLSDETVVQLDDSGMCCSIDWFDDEELCSLAWFDDEELCSLAWFVISS
ncbi:unnamed protein product [Mytilus edulis]|uniref:Uncharacterized protein n=1 Tax=Mytilus edulis TaxID=6550 RepID=A0A8S3SNF1_MYTED|nr:unnamed protein product [Mytilus edulis]